MGKGGDAVRRERERRWRRREEKDDKRIGLRRRKERSKTPQRHREKTEGP